MPVAVVTDSTACLPWDIARDRVTVVPIQVTLNGVSGAEGRDISTADMAVAFRQRRVEVSTSRPAPGEFEAAYRRLLDGGVDSVVSVHLSADLSGTYESALLASKEFGDRVCVVDSANIGMGLGFSVLEAVSAAEDGADLSTVADRAVAGAAHSRTFFYVDTLEFLRRGGRISAASALLGTALAVKPILRVDDGQIVLRDKVRTSVRALARLEDLACEAGAGEVDVAVHHLQDPERAARLADRLRERFGKRVRDLHVTEVGAVVAAHAGPGLLGVVVHRRS